MTENAQSFANAIVESAASVVQAVQARAVMVYAEAVPDLERLRHLMAPLAELILIQRTGERPAPGADQRVRYLAVPDFDLTRMDQIKMATLLAFSQRMLEGGDTFVALSGLAGRPVDTMMVMQVDREYELFHTVDQPKVTEHVRRVVFQRVLSIALELAHEGREGKPVGALFVVGTDRALARYTEQNIINPFRGYAEKDRNVLDDAMKNTVKGFAVIDGAFVIRGNGVIVSAGTTLRPGISGSDLPPGLGARHAAAAAISASTRCIAITVSESTGAVRLWRRGRMVTEIERAPAAPLPQVLPSGPTPRGEHAGRHPAEPG